MNFWDVRCTLPPRGYKPGPCNGLLFRISSTGGIEVKCNYCREVQVIHRTELDNYVTEPFQHLH